MGVDIDLLLHRRNAGLIAADLEVGVRDVGGDRDAHAGQIGLGGLGGGVGRLLAAPQSAGEVDLPTGGGADIVEPLVAVVAREGIADPAQRRVQRLPQGRGLRRRIDGREQRRTGTAALRPGPAARGRTTPPESRFSASARRISRSPAPGRGTPSTIGRATLRRPGCACGRGGVVERRERGGGRLVIRPDRAGAERQQPGQREDLHLASPTRRARSGACLTWDGSWTRNQMA